MKIIQIIVLVLLLYFLIVILISSVRALLAIKKGKEQVKKSFRETFFHFFLELLNPFNWI